MRVLNIKHAYEHTLQKNMSYYTRNALCILFVFRTLQLIRIGKEFFNNGIDLKLFITALMAWIALIIIIVLLSLKLTRRGYKWVQGIFCISILELQLSIFIFLKDTINANKIDKSQGLSP